MIREKVTHKDYFKIARENEYFLWHFLQKDQNETSLAFSSVIDEIKETNLLPMVLDNVDIPYFESYTEDSIDFLMGLGISHEKLYTPTTKPIRRNEKFGTLIIGFKKFTNISSTFDYCYCPEGLVSVISDLNPKYIEQLNKNL